MKAEKTKKKDPAIFPDFSPAKKGNKKPDSDKIEAGIISLAAGKKGNWIVNPGRKRRD